MRATLRLSSPAWLAQPRMTSSTASAMAGWRARRARIGTAARSSATHHRQRAAVAADRRARRVADEDVAAHASSPPWARRVRACSSRSTPSSSVGRRRRLLRRFGEAQRPSRNSSCSRFAGDAGMERDDGHLAGLRIGLEHAEIGDQPGRALGPDAERLAAALAGAVAERGDEGELRRRSRASTSPW